VNPNETLATHIFENEPGDPNLSGPVVGGRSAIGLAQIYDTTISRSTNPKGWAHLARRWNLKSGQKISDSLKRNPKFATDYLAWRMAGSRSDYGSLDAWYRSPGYNPNFTGDARGPGPSVFDTENSTSFAQGRDGPLFPVTGSNWSYTSEWGDPRDGGARLHKGIDIAAPRGTPVVAVADGIARKRLGGPGGNAIWINGKYYYAHLSKFAVSDGQKVKKGDVIGYVGSTGTSSTGPHLHFGIDPKGGFSDGGSWVDPRTFLSRAAAGGAVPPGPHGDPDSNPGVDPHGFLFPDTESPLPFQVGPPLVGPPPSGPQPVGPPPVGPQSFPGFATGLGIEGRDVSSGWKVIAEQEGAGHEAQRYAASFAGGDPVNE